MNAIVAEREAAPWYERLFLPAYRLGDAARYTGAHPNTVAAWHYRSNAVLPGRERKEPLCYLELVEVAFVAYFRRVGVPLSRIRKAREYVGKTFHSRHPFAEHRFKSEGQHLLMDYFRRDKHPSANELIVADAGGQLAWANVMGDKFAEFDYELELALTWHPAGRDSAVKIDPRVAFGEPVAEGIPTLAIKGRWVAGESLAEIVEDWGVSQQTVKDALEFEGVIISGDDNRQ